MNKTTNKAQNAQTRIGLKLQSGVKAGTDPALYSGNYRISDALRGSATNLVGK